MTREEAIEMLTIMQKTELPYRAKAIDMAISALSAEPIRCKDCKHYEFADNRAFGMPVKYCDWFGFEDVDDNDFCSRAERREP